MRQLLIACAISILSTSLYATPYPLLDWGQSQKSNLLKVAFFKKPIKNKDISKKASAESCQGAAVSNMIIITVKTCNEIAVETRTGMPKEEKIIQ